MFTDENKNTSNDTVGQKIDRTTHKAEKNLKGEETFGQKVDKAKENVKDFGKDVKENVREKAISGADKVQEKAEDAKDNLKTEDEKNAEKTLTERATELIAEGWEKAKDGVEWVGEKLQETFAPTEEDRHEHQRDLRESKDDTVGQKVDKGLDKMRDKAKDGAEKVEDKAHDTKKELSKK
jgi:gas vesicle protein